MTKKNTRLAYKIIEPGSTFITTEYDKVARYCRCVQILLLVVYFVTWLWLLLMVMSVKTEGGMIVITFMNCKIHLHSIIRSWAAFWLLTRLQICGSAILLKPAVLDFIWSPQQQIKQFAMTNLVFGLNESWTITPPGSPASDFAGSALAP